MAKIKKKKMIQALMLENTRFKKIGELAFFKPGYLRYLKSLGKADFANKRTLTLVQENRERLHREDEDRRMKAENQQKVLENQTLTLAVETSERGMLYGSVCPRNISQKIKELWSIDIAPTYIGLGQVIREIGTYTAQIALHPTVVFSLNIQVVAAHQVGS